MNRGIKLGGGALVLAVVCLASWYLLSRSQFMFRPTPRLPFSVRKFFVARPTQSPRTANLPNLYLWAWERPEDLQFLGNKKVGIAFLAKTISLATSGRYAAEIQHSDGLTVL